MTYDWEPYKDTCYRLYVEEKKSLRQVHKILAENHSFTPRYVDSNGHLLWLPVSQSSASGYTLELHPPLWLPVQPSRHNFIQFSMKLC